MLPFPLPRPAGHTTPMFWTISSLDEFEKIAT
jgi:hypothetical protein